MTVNKQKYDFEKYRKQAAARDILRAHKMIDEAHKELDALDGKQLESAQSNG